MRVTTFGWTRVEGKGGEAMHFANDSVREGIEGVVIAVVSAVRRGFWQSKRWTLQDTLAGEGGVWLICPEGHAYWGRSLSGAERELVEARQDCMACSHGRALVTLI